MPTALDSTIKRRTEHDWQLRHIADFWDWCSSNPVRRGSYFTSLVGQGICGFLKGQTRLEGRLLDFGCGTGHLLELLLEQNRRLEGYGLEFSSESAQAAEKRLKGRANWRGACHVSNLPGPFEKDSFQVITFVETIEHLKEETLAATLVELHRVLAPGGRLLITTPFEENLEAGMVFCPFCHSEFHRMQHMRSFSRESLRELLESFDLQVLYCNNVNLRLQGSLFDRLVLGGMEGVRRWILSRRGVPAAPPPHLVAVATK